jgi:hypothetical protein
MRKTTKAILGVVSGVALTIGTATAAPPNLPDTSSSNATKEASVTKANKLPGAKVKVKEGAKAGQQSETTLKSVKIKESAKTGRADGAVSMGAPTVKTNKGDKTGQ